MTQNHVIIDLRAMPNTGVGPKKASFTCLRASGKHCAGCQMRKGSYDSVVFCYRAVIDNYPGSDIGKRPDHGSGHDHCTFSNFRAGADARCRVQDTDGASPGQGVLFIKLFPDLVIANRNHKTGTRNVESGFCVCLYASARLKRPISCHLGINNDQINLSGESGGLGDYAAVATSADNNKSHSWPPLNAYRIVLSGAGLSINSRRTCMVERSVWWNLLRLGSSRTEFMGAI